MFEQAPPSKWFIIALALFLLALVGGVLYAAVEMFMRVWEGR